MIKEEVQVIAWLPTGNSFEFVVDVNGHVLDSLCDCRVGCRVGRGNVETIFSMR